MNQALNTNTTKEQWKEKIPTEYQQFIDMLDSKLVNLLLPSRQYDHKMTIKQGTESSFGLLSATF